MKKKSLSIFTAFIMFSFALVLFLPVPSQAKTIKLKYADFFPPVHKTSVTSKEWCMEVEKRTNGRVKITYLPGGTLVPAPQAYEAAVRGIADISMTVPAWAAGRFPLSEVLELPLGYTNAIHASGLANAFYKKFRPKEYDDVKVFYHWAVGPGYFMTVKPVRSIEGLKHLKIRAGGNQSKIAAAMGAAPVSVPISDIYEGLRRGVIDGILFYPESLKGWRFGDSIRWLRDNPALGFTGVGVIVMNKEKWNSLPPDIQKIIDQINEEWMVKQGKVWEELRTEGMAYGVSKGMTVFKISPEEIEITKEKMKPILNEYVKNMKEKGLPGAEALKFCQDYLKAHP
jgi:TRAP-type C4-dicarboxylate transport system substrate-binding protein